LSITERWKEDRLRLASPQSDGPWICGPHEQTEIENESLQPQAISSGTPKFKRRDRLPAKDVYPSH